MTSLDRTRSLRTLRLATFCVALATLAAESAYAQAEPGSIYISAGLVFPRQDGVSGTVSLNYGEPPGGSTQGRTISGGVFVAPRAGVELEILETGTMHARERVRSGGGRVATYDEDRRSRLFNVNFRLHVSRWRRVQFMPLGGVGFVQHQGWSQLIAVNAAPLTNPNDTPVVAPRQRRNLPMDIGVILGFDLRVGGERFALVPSFRFWRRGGDIRTSDEQYQQYVDGGPEWIVIPGVVARFDF